MMLIKEGIDLYLLYTSSGQFIGNGSIDSIYRILRKYAKKVRGNRVKFYSVIERIFWENNTYKEHEKYLSELWENKFRDEYEEVLESMVDKVLAESKVKTVIPKLKIIGKKEKPKKVGIIRFRH